jgi:hypothetical protein
LVFGYYGEGIALVSDGERGGGGIVVDCSSRCPYLNLLAVGNGDAALL